MKRLTLFLALLAVATLGNMMSASQAFAQVKSDTLQVWAVETRDGNEYLGSLIDSTGTEITDYDNISDVSFVKVNLIVNVNPLRLPNEFMLRGTATLRNLKVNL